MSPAADGRSLYERVGGSAFFEALVDRFYDGVADDPLLRPMYREGDLSEERRWLALFLAQYWGGPGDYSAERGHPRLRMRHFPFSIGAEERDAWMGHMRAAVEASSAGAAEQAELVAYFESAADFMINRE
jgi:hemoglobin